ncbi:unnamed protein product [marine sediment metagenome]|uniref:Uncharacterized protein n=1 Tax=marine sediment metagenome TaxID=412755 RepID=X0SMM2_9ZZZZ
MLEVGSLVYFKNGAGEILKCHTGLITRERDNRPHGRPYFIKWSGGGDWINDWYDRSYLVEVKNNV